MREAPAAIRGPLFLVGGQGHAEGLGRQRKTPAITRVIRVDYIINREDFLKVMWKSLWMLAERSLAELMEPGKASSDTRRFLKVIAEASCLKNSADLEVRADRQAAYRDASGRHEGIDDPQGKLRGLSLRWSGKIRLGQVPAGQALTVRGKKRRHCKGK